MLLLSLVTLSYMYFPSCAVHHTIEKNIFHSHTDVRMYSHLSFSNNNVTTCVCVKCIFYDDGKLRRSFTKEENSLQRSCIHYYIILRRQRKDFPQFLLQAYNFTTHHVTVYPHITS